MKKFAFFLPQFHEIKENNEWWGEHFTEWTNVKAAKKLYRGHVQPIRPLNNNYYNLLEKQTVEWQTKLADDYHVDGFIYYHYYFTGKMLLEKPAENLLKWKEIKQKFFFCWANHSWIRSWNGTREILLEQKYGKEEEWEKHFEYLLPFFCDERYEKKDNKPLFMIFQPNFSEAKEMFSFFDKKCKENGFDGICLIESRNRHMEGLEKSYPQTEYLFLREPDNTVNSFHTGKRNVTFRFKNKVRTMLHNKGIVSYVRKYSGKKFFKDMNKNCIDRQDVINGAYFTWDNTPRHKHRGYIITETTKKLFFSYMDKLKNKEYVFFNAWNEWAEGMILEPTEENGYKYLEWIKEWTEKTYNKK